MSNPTYVSDLEKAEHLPYEDGKGVKRVSIYNDGQQINAASEESQNAVISLLNQIKFILGPSLDRYWVGGSGDFYDINHWSSYDGGPGGETYPDNTMNVFITPNSGVNFTISTDSTFTAKNFTSTNGGNYTINCSSAQFFGITTFEPGITLNTSTLGITGNGTFTGKVFNLNGMTYTGNLSLSNEIFSLAHDLNLTGYFECYGGLNTNDFDITAKGFYFTGQDNNPSNTFSFGSSTLTCNAVSNYFNYFNFDTQNNYFTLSVDAGTSQFILNAPDGGIGTIKCLYTNVTLNNLSISGNNTTYTFEGNFTFNELTITGNNHTVNFYDISQSLTTANKFTFTGSSEVGGEIKLSNPWVGAFTLSQATGTVDAQYINITGCTATGGATFNATNSTDGGNNTGWNFI